MTPDVVVDVGNSRLKWGVIQDGRVTEVMRLPLNDPAAWDAALAKLPPTKRARQWAAASVNPPALSQFMGWSYNHGSTVPFEDREFIPIELNVDFPEKVGIDRLFGAVAAKALRPEGVPAITVDVGTAVTVNFIDGNGVFCGGAIMPGPRLMALSLHRFTAKLPLVEADIIDDFSPGKNTADAIKLGLDAMLNGGVMALLSLFADQCETNPWLFLTGGAEPLLTARMPSITETHIVPTLVLEGIRIAAESLKQRVIRE
jgi:type III pantothenate kinase